MRAWVATVLVKAAVHVVGGVEDRHVLLNTQLKRSKQGSTAGRIPAFIGHDDELGPFAWAFPPDDHCLDHLGTPVPAYLARLAGWRVKSPY